MTATRPLLSAEEIWRAYDDMEVRLTAHLSVRMLDLAGVGPGKRVLDLATGRGEPAIPAAHLVGPKGSVLGVDVSETMLAMARERADREGVTNLDLRVMNAAALEGIPASTFDATVIRWGLMYMNAPVAALEGAARAMAPGGLLVAAVFVEPERVQYLTFPRRVLAKYSPLPPIDYAAPGPFHYADLERLRADLGSAGFRVHHVEELALPVTEAETPAEIVAWTRAFGLSKLLNDLPEEIQRAWEEDLSREAEALRTDGWIRLSAVTRIVVAQKNDHAHRACDVVPMHG